MILMSKNEHLLVPFNGRRNPFNIAAKICGMEQEKYIDLLYVKNLNRYNSDDFPQDAVFDLIRIADNIDRLYSCDAVELGKYIRKNGKSTVYTALCQYCQMVINLIKGNGRTR